MSILPIIPKNLFGPKIDRNTSSSYSLWKSQTQIQHEKKWINQKKDYIFKLKAFILSTDAVRSLVKIEIDTAGRADGTVKVQIDRDRKKLCDTDNLIQAMNSLKVRNQIDIPNAHTL